MVLTQKFPKMTPHSLQIDGSVCFGIATRDGGAKGSIVVGLVVVGVVAAGLLLVTEAGGVYGDMRGGPFMTHTLAGIDMFPDYNVNGRNYSALDYLVESMYEPNKYVVAGFNPGMPQIDKPPIGLTDEEILCVIAYLETLGGEPTVTMDTTHAYLSGPGPGEAAVSGGAS